MTAPVLKVLSPGFLTTVQDAGRPAHAASGVPCSGALDAEAFLAANILAGNRGGEAGLEAWFAGPRLVATCRVRVVVAGGPFGPSPGRAVTLDPGEEIAIEPSRPGARCVVAVSGGIDVPLLLGSRSTLLAAGFGGLGGRALRAGDELPLGRRQGEPRPGASLPAELLGSDDEVLAIRVGPGADLSLFGEEARATFFGTHWTVRSDASRAGFPLGGGAVLPADRGERPSLPTFPGVVQVTRDGTPIVLMAEGPVTGGYPQLGTVAAVDLPRLVRVRPGQKIRFSPVTWDEAARLLGARRERMAAWQRSLASST